MPFQPVEATAEVELIYLLFGQVVENTYFFRKSTDYDVSALEALTSSMFIWWSEELAPYLSNSITLTSIKSTAKHSITGPQFEAGFDSDNVGLVASVSEPSNNAACISLRTALIGRAFRGRNFIAGIPSNVVTGNALSSTWLNNIANAYTTLIDSPPPSQTYVHVTRVVDHVVQDPVALTNPITSALFKVNTVRSMRRRTAGVGI